MNIFYKYAVLFFPLILAGQEWVQLSSYPGPGRHHPITFSNNQFGFVMAGQNSSGEYLEDVYKYNPINNEWSQVSNFPGGPRGYGYGVSNNTHAFVGFGKYQNQYPTDWWRYDLENDNWVELTPFPGQGRNHPAMILLDNKIYVGMGSTNQNFGDWWEYNIESDSWSEKSYFDYGDRHHPYYFSASNKIFVGFGHGNSQNGSMTIYNDFYEYDHENDNWIEINNFEGEGRVAGTQFSFEGKGYILSGDGDNHGPLDYGEFWQYDAINNIWNELTPHPGGARWAPGTFVINCDVYLTSGFEQDSNTMHNDLLKFNLDENCSCSNYPMFENYYYNDELNYLPNCDVSHDLELESGWSLISTYIIPNENNLEEIFSENIDNIYIIKDSNGNVFWPEFGINEIDSLKVGLGYQVKITNDDTLKIIGQPSPLSSIINLNEGWNIIGCLSPTNINIDLAFQNFISNVEILKDSWGNAFWPTYNLNNVGNLAAGQAYQIKTNDSIPFFFNITD